MRNGNVRSRRFRRGEHIRKVLLLASQIVVEIARRFVARAGVLFQAARDRPAQRRGNLRIDGLRFRVENGRHGFDAGPGRERPRARRLS